MWKPWSRLSTRWGTKLVVSKNQKIYYKEENPYKWNKCIHRSVHRTKLSHELIGRKAQGDTKTTRREALLAPGFEAETQN